MRKNANLICTTFNTDVGYLDIRGGRELSLDKWIFTTSMLETPQEGEIGYWSDQGALVIADLNIFEMEGL